MDMIFDTPVGTRVRYTSDPRDPSGQTPLDEANRAAIATWVTQRYAVTAPLPTRSDVNVERDRRTANSFVFNGAAFDLDPASLQRITGAATLAGFAVNAGSPVENLRWANADVDFMWIAKDNSKVSMDAQTAFAFGQAAANHVSRYVFVADAIKSLDPIPEDYADDKWWP